MRNISSDEEGTVYQLRRIGSPATLSSVADVFKLKHDVTVIGRDKKAVEFFIDSSKHKGLISRIHARIFRSRTHSGKHVFKICDTSLNGTYVNGIKILNEASLRPGDIVAFGHLQGAALQAGKCYSQPDSEFRFKFESPRDAQSSRNPNDLSETDCVENSELETADYLSEDYKTRRASDLPDLSIFLETPTPSPSLHSSNKDSEESNCTTKRKLMKNFNKRDSEESDSDYRILQEYASAASHAALMDSDSEDDLFSLKYTSILPGGAAAMLGNDNPCKSPEKRKQKSKVNLQTKKTTRPSKKARSEHLENCSALNCLMPCGKLISWVQCDDCDQWFHVKCAGLTLKLVKPKNAKFHCGCT